MILDRIKNFFKRKRNTCLFMYITNLHYVPIYLHPNLNKYEREVNKRALKTSKIVTVNHGIKIFSRFLKYHNSYEIYKRDLKYCRININDVITEISQVQLSSEDTAEIIADEIIRPGVLVLLKLVLFLLIFLAVRFLLGMVSGVICKIADLPILKQVNKTLGAIAGIIKGITLIFAFSIFFNFLSELLKNTNVFAQAIENSHICDIIIELIK